MLDQLRAMGVFACVVEKSSFSGAARELGITTSAVSQQIRSLEHEMEVTLLHRSTRKLSLTEAGQAFFYSCQEMLAAAERGKVRINELRDDLIGELRISATPELAAQHAVPALSHWMQAHRGLAVHFETDNDNIDLIDGRIDIALRVATEIDDTQFCVQPLLRAEQILVASPSYLNQNNPVSRPEDLQQHDLLLVNTFKNQHELNFTHVSKAEQLNLSMHNRLSSNSAAVARALCLNGHGIARVFYLDVQKDLVSGALVEVLPEWKLPPLNLYAVTLKHEQSPMKVDRCLDALKQYFCQMAAGRVYQEAS